MNYKIRVESEAESKECQGLFIKYGLKLSSWSNHMNLPFYICNWVDGQFSNYELRDSGLNQVKEITIQQLKDLVVLKRNSIDDATHKCETSAKRLGYLTSSGVEYIWSYGNSSWFKPEEMNFKSHNLKPIEKPMKEYLRKNIDGEYVLEVTDEREAQEPHAKHWIEIPEGAEVAVYYKYKDKVFFWKDAGKTHWGESSRLQLGWYDCSANMFTRLDEFLDEWADQTTVIWKRETLNDQVASAETARQSDKVLKEILEGDLPEFKFEAIDAFIESNVEQGQKHSHYKKDASHLNVIDIYRVTEMFKPHSCGAHIVKKALCSGQRGHKDLLTDIQDIIDTAERWKEMLIEDENSCKD